jgi:hypothetical protein
LRAGFQQGEKSFRHFGRKEAPLQQPAPIGDRVTETSQHLRKHRFVELEPLAGKVPKENIAGELGFLAVERQG